MRLLKDIQYQKCRKALKKRENWMKIDQETAAKFETTTRGKITRSDLVANNE